MNPLIEMAPRVAEALAQNRPVVALESTIITHGMPFPQNVEVARSVEAIVRSEGAESATIAVMEGRLVIGIDDDQLQQLAKLEDVRKLSTADLAHALVRRDNGSTTVAATMAAMRASGLRVFATGGIGGVHRGAETSFDMSADLDALAEQQLIVVCAGPKAILDVPLTLEALETRGVPVVALGTDTLPTFWSRDGRLPAPLAVDTEQEVAAIFLLRQDLQQKGSVLVTVPVPSNAAIESDEIHQAIETALSDASRAGISGKDVTPYLLSRMFELTDGRSLVTNTALIENNARVASRIAVALTA